MRRTLTATLTAAVMTLGAVAFAAPATATEGPPPEQCVEREAWTEVIEHPAVGEPTITVPNPDYVPEVPGVPGTPAIGEPTIIVTEPNPDYVPAVPEVPEVSHTDYHAKRWVVDEPAQEAVYETHWKYTKHGGHGFIWVDNDTWKYIDGDGNGHDKKPKKGTFYERTQHTKQVKVKDAVEEKGHWEWEWFHEEPGSEWIVKDTQKHVTQEYVPGVPAQGSETIEVEKPNPDYVPAVPAVDPIPAVGEPTIEVSNPDYVPAWTETIEHPAVECPVVIPPKPDDLVRTASSQEIDCDNGIVTETWTEETATHVWDEEAEAWIVGEWSEPVVTHTPQHVLTEEEREVVCPTVTPEPEPEPQPEPEPEPTVEPKPEPKPEPTVEPTVEPTPVADNGPRKELAATGGDHVLPMTAGVLGLAMLALGGALAVRRRSQN